MEQFSIHVFVSVRGRFTVLVTAFRWTVSVPLSPWTSWPMITFWQSSVVLCGILSPDGFPPLAFFASPVLTTNWWHTTSFELLLWPSIPWQPFVIKYDPLVQHCREPCLLLLRLTEPLVTDPLPSLIGRRTRRRHRCVIHHLRRIPQPCDCLPST